MKNRHVQRRPPKRLTLTKRGRIASITAQEIADMTGIALRTARAYRADPRKMPPHIRELIELKALGIVPGLSDAFIRDGAIHVQGGYSYTPAQLQQITYVYQALSEYKRLVSAQASRIQQLDAALDDYRQKAGAPMAVNDSDG